MKKIILPIFTILLFLSCNKEQKLEYKYADKEDLFNCSSIDMELIKDAVYAFEDHITQHYIAIPPNTLSKGYAFYWEIALRDLQPTAELFNNHLIQLVKRLKKEKKLWVVSKDKTTLNYNHPIMLCIAKNIKDKGINKTLNVLLETKSFRTKIFLPAFLGDNQMLIDDKALATFFALEMFYARVLDLNFDNITNEEASNKNSN
ncbi:hypothetical protein JYT89_02535 [Flavobacteriaceae bacterium AH-315-B10]|nr:hypothetical protein [Flavobacteriaceae bacterium AH-315-B10]